MAKTTELEICPARVKELLDNTLSKLNTDCTNLIGRNFGISKPNYEIITFEEFLNKNEDKFYLIKSELEDSYKGFICTVMQLKDAIKIGGTLLGNEDHQIKEKIKKEELDEEYADGIQEFGNQYSGVIDAVFRNKLQKSVHVKISLCTALDKDNAKDILKNQLNDDYMHLSSLLLIKGFETGKFSLFVSCDLIEDFYGEQLHEKSTNVLVIDDSMTDIRIIKKYLANTEFRVLPATTPSEAYTILQKEKIHLILLDVIMPELDGIEICKKIKKTPYTKGIPIVMISAKPTEASVIESLQSGARDFMVKPLSKHKLIQRIDKYKVKKKQAILF